MNTSKTIEPGGWSIQYNAHSSAEPESWEIVPRFSKDAKPFAVVPIGARRWHYYQSIAMRVAAIPDLISALYGLAMATKNTDSPEYRYAIEALQKAGAITGDAL